MICSYTSPRRAFYSDPPEQGILCVVLEKVAYVRVLGIRALKVFRVVRIAISFVFSDLRVDTQRTRHGNAAGRAVAGISRGDDLGWSDAFFHPLIHGSHD